MKRLFLLLALLCSTTMMAAAASAFTLSLSPPSQQVPVGGTASVALAVSGLGTAPHTSLAGFDVTLAYDPAILAITAANVTFGPALGDPALTTETDVAATVGTGTLRLFEVSFLSADQLDLLQGDSFTLATLSFTAIGAGLSGLSFSDAALSDAFGGSLDVTTTGASLNAVPEPTTLLLVSSGLAGLAGFARRRTRRA